MHKAESYQILNRKRRAYLSLNPFILTEKIRKYGGFHISRTHILLLYFTKILLGGFFAFVEYVFYVPSILKTQVNDQPVFVIGHFRSGTTLMHKYLSNDPQFGYVRNADLLLPYFFPALRKLIIRLTDGLLNLFAANSYAYNDVPFRLTDTQEEDMALTCMVSARSSYWSFVFPRNAEDIFRETIFSREEEAVEHWKDEYMYFLKKISLQNDRKRLVLKNPANTGRLKILAELFPKAKFIFLHRDPYDTFYSMKRLVKRSVSNFSLQKIENEKLEKITFEHYKNLHDIYLKEKQYLKPSQLIEVRYESFIADPVGTMENIYKQLEIGDFSEVSESVKNMAKAEKSYTPFKYNKDAEVDDLIREHWGKYINLWHYNKT